MKITEYQKLISQKIIAFDGAMGTNIQRFNPTLDDYRGKEGCNEILCLTRPGWIQSIHADFLNAGCDFIETNSFGSNRVVLDEYGLLDKAYELSRAAAALAREVAEQFSLAGHRRYVAGSMGPGTKLPSLGHVEFDFLRSAYAEQAEGLLAGGADLLIIETCQDLLQIKAAINGALDAQRKLKVSVPMTVQVTIEATGTMLLGSDMASAITAVECFPVQTIGINCATGPAEMIPHVRTLSENTDRYISVLPNAGLPENVSGKAVYKLSPEEFAEHLLSFVNKFGVNVIGGCCGTTKEHLKKAVEAVSRVNPKQRKIDKPAQISSLYQSVTIRQAPPPLIIGERTNANGSKAFRDLLGKDDYDSIANLAKEQEAEGSHALDVCTAYVGRDEKKDMGEIVRRLALQSKIPLMIDSTELSVLEAALKLLGGKSIVNSINLEEGEERVNRVCNLTKTYGAAVVALTIDEEGMAKSADRKVAVAKRIYDLAVNQNGLAPGDILFDALTFTLGSGEEELRRAGMETLSAIRRIKSDLPGVHTVLGVSNISFGLNPAARNVLNSVFLHYALEAGLDAAIVNFKKITPFDQISERPRRLAKDLIFDERKISADGAVIYDPLKEFMSYFTGATNAPVMASVKSQNVEDELRQRIIQGNKQNIDVLLQEALQTHPALEIINDILLEGMRKVGELFGAGQIQLPFVLQSAETMKAAVKFLEPHMPKSASGRKKGKMVLATVKGDVHDIGKNLVDIILTNNGYEVINLGIKQPIADILRAAEKHGPDAIGLSGLLVKSTNVMKENLEEMNRLKLDYQVVLGGAALTKKFVDEELKPLYNGRVYYALDAFAGLRIMDELTNPKLEKKLTRIDIGAAHTKASQAVERSSPTPQQGPAASRPPMRAAEFIPQPPFWGTKVVDKIDIEDVFPFINETALLNVRWGFKRVPDMSSQQFRQMFHEKVEPLFREWKEFVAKNKVFSPRVVYGYFPCVGDGDSLLILKDDLDSEMMRFDFPRQKKSPYRCISDFFLPQGGKTVDVVGMMLVTIGAEASQLIQEKFKGGAYTDYLYLHGLSVESAEALAEYWHQVMRKELKIAQYDAPEKRALFQQKYQGSRFSFGYPACPNLEDQSKLFDLLQAGRIGVSISETFQLHPEQSTSAIIVHHPDAKYFAVD